MSANSCSAEWGCKRNQGILLSYNIRGLSKPLVRRHLAIAIGSVRLLPYIRGWLPGDAAHAKQRDIDAILRAYAVRKNKAVEKATILELGAWRRGQDIKRRVAAVSRVAHIRK